MQEIKNINDIVFLLQAGFDNWQDLGSVSVHENGDLRIFNYTQHAQFEARWNYFERVSRGLIVNAKTGEIVARPFDKFFNWGENNRFSEAHIKLVTEKMDGSLGILYRDNGCYRIATRGSFDSDQAMWATEFLQRNYDLSGFLNDITPLFEIIYPDNRIVVDYNGREDLVLLAVRNRFTDQYYPWSTVENIASTFGFSLPNVYQFETPDQLVKASESLSANAEGWVVEFDDGQRFKFKGDEYRKLHKLISGLSFKNTLECIASGSIDELRAVVPDEFLSEVNSWVDEIQSIVQHTQAKIEQAFILAPKNTRKDFALWVMENHKPIAPYMFAKFDGRPVESLIYKNAFNDSVKELQ